MSGAISSRSGIFRSAGWDLSTRRGSTISASISPYGDHFSYEGWAGHYDLVKLNLQNSNVTDYLLEAVGYWIDEFGIDGLRLDAANVMDVNFFKKLKDFCKWKKEDFWMFGEIVGGDYNRIANPDALDSCTNYEIYKGLFSCHNDRNYFEFAHSVDRQCGDWGMYKNIYMYNFADNHDVTRLASIIRDKVLQKNVYTMLYCMPGVPSVYYGSEFGMEGKKQRNSDDDLRRELNLDALENPDQVLFEHICKLGHLRHCLDALQNGKYKNELIQLEHMCFSMKTDHQKVYIMLNQSAEYRNIGINTNFSGVLTDVLNDNTQYGCNGWVEISVPPMSSMILVENDGSFRIDYPSEQESVIINNSVSDEEITDDETTVAEVEPDLVPEEIVKGKYRHFKGRRT